MRCLVTGGSGFVGTHVLRYLEDNTDWEIVAPLSDLTNGLPEVGDFDYVINLASGSSVEESINDPVNFIENNVGLILRVLEYARYHKVKSFIQFSTVEVYNISNPYAASKAAQEAICTAYAKTYGLPVTITTSDNIIGEGQNPEKFVPKIVQAIKKGNQIEVYTDNGAIGSRVYNPVENICSALLFILNSKHRLPRYHIGGGEELSNLEMAEKIADTLKKPLRYSLMEASLIRPGYSRHLISDGTRLEELGWQPPVTVEEGLAWIK